MNHILIANWIELAARHCCTNVCGNQCLDGTGNACCGGTAVCSAGQTCVAGNCTSMPPVQSVTPTSTPNSPSPTPSPVASNPTPTPTPDPLSELNAGVPPSAKADLAAACFLSTQFSCYYTTPAWYTSLPSDAQSYYSSTNSVADHSAFCTSTAIINPQCNSTSPHASLSPGAKGGIGVGKGAPAFKPFLTGPPPPPTLPYTSPPTTTQVPTIGPNATTGPTTGPNTTSGWAGVSGPGAIPPPPLPHHGVPVPFIVGAYRRQGDRDQNRTIPRKAIASASSQESPSPSHPSMSEAGGGSISEMSETGARSATISSADDIASGSRAYGMHELQGEEVYEIPEGTRRYEAPDQ
ncbi:hypothetical protein L207DRAFT_572798 [Hyaloscypha variabilis F]|uniref:Uncharacterized protein n=1 Tax=Hyaloscypha variabilis (strain UAMH 11265 / GT02V1 / F) TaxID=1149755 RepID=A0A2J6QZA8_HYAVF|nr:hypothetical protein L207DRAFT_572798 [Hyaloscypha variabilis F]